MVVLPVFGQALARPQGKRTLKRIAFLIIEQIGNIVNGQRRVLEIVLGQQFTGVIELLLEGRMFRTQLALQGAFAQPQFAGGSLDAAVAAGQQLGQGTAHTHRKGIINVHFGQAA